MWGLVFNTRDSIKTILFNEIEKLIIPQRMKHFTDQLLIFDSCRVDIKKM